MVQAISCTDPMPQTVGTARCVPGVVERQACPQHFFLVVSLLETMNPPSPASVHSSSGLTALLAEDENSVRDTIAAVLRQHAFEVIEAADGEAALRAFNEHRSRISILVFDVMMPRMNGFAVFRRIRETDPVMPAIFCSGCYEDFIEEIASLPSHTRMLNKPFVIAELYGAIAELLGISTASLGSETVRRTHGSNPP